MPKSYESYLKRIPSVRRCSKDKIEICQQNPFSGRSNNYIYLKKSDILPLINKLIRALARWK